MKNQRLDHSRPVLSLIILFTTTFFLLMPGSLPVLHAQAAAMVGPDSYEPDNTAAQAKQIVPGTFQTHSIVPASDVDWVQFQLTTPSAVVLETGGAAGNDTRMWLYNSGLTEIRFSDDEGTGFYSYINTCDLANLPAGTYYVKVDEFNNNHEISSYTLSLVSGSNCLGVALAGAFMGVFPLYPGASTRQSYAGANNGPVQIYNLDGAPIIAAERIIYKVNGVNTSFSEMMTLPNNQLSGTLWLPWYNNVDLDTQIRIANPSIDRVPVSVSIGGVAMPGGSLVLDGGSSVRLSFPGVNDGPVRISGSGILASQRVIYKINGVPTSFSEMMALPNHQLDRTHWLPWYNNVDLDSQLRLANVDIDTALVDVYIGGTLIQGSPFIIRSDESTRLSFPGVNDGPVKIVSSGNIVAALRVIYKVNGINTSFSEMMALPNNQLQGTYWLPWYNNVDLDTQLRIANPSIDRIPVSIYIGGVLMPGGSFVLDGESSVRLSFPGVNNGPVMIIGSGILAAERVIYKVNGTPTSFSEMMALPNSQLDITYWLPWYNNVDLDTQLRFGVP